MTVGDRIRKRRIELELSQDELAKKVGYKSRSSIQKIECARNLPLPKVEKMARALGCTPAYLMGWETIAVTEPPTIMMPELPHYDWEDDSETEKALEIYRDIQSLSPERRQALEEYLRYLKSQS